MSTNKLILSVFVPANQYNDATIINVERLVERLEDKTYSVIITVGSEVKQSKGYTFYDANRYAFDLVEAYAFNEDC